MRFEPALTAAVRGGLADVEPILGVLPVPLILVEPGTARLLYANEAAHRLAGDPLALSSPKLYDASGHLLEPDELPSARAARGETLSHVPFDWETPAGMRTLLISGTTIDQQVTVVTFEDATELETERRRSSLLADELRVMLDGVADAITVQSHTGLIYINEAAARFYGIPRGRELEDFSTAEYVQRYEIFDDTGKPLDLARLPGRLALAGLDPEPITIHARNRETGEVNWTRVKATGVRDPDGSVRLAINVMEDITELKRSEQSQRFLAEASRRLAGSLDYERTLAEVAELAVPAIADRCAVSLAGEDSDAPVAAFAVMRTGVARLEPRRMIVPMVAAGRVTGTLTLEVRGRVFDTHDVLAAEDFGLRAGAALENARLYRAASQLAQTLQTSLLPPHLPDVPGAELAAAYHPAMAGARGRRRLLRRVHDRRGPVVPRHGRCLRQGAGGRRRDRARALHAAHRRGAAPLPGRDPALGRRGDAAAGPGGRALLHDRLRAHRPQPQPRAGHRVLRRAPAAGAAAGGRERRVDRRARDAARARPGP